MKPGSIALQWLLLAAMLGGTSLTACQSAGVTTRGTAAPEAADAYTLAGPRSYFDGYPSRSPDGGVNVVIEIPAGTTAKWEVDKSDGKLRWEFKQGKPRVVDYLGYPGNYGMVPGTVLPVDEGGDGDPLDVIVLGPALQRGSVVSTRLIGVLRVLDGGERDDKLIAVRPGSTLGDVTSLRELDAKYAGASWIVETWFANYKGAGVMESRGFAAAEEAQRVLKAAIEAFGKR